MQDMITRLILAATLVLAHGSSAAEQTTAAGTIQESYAGLVDFVLQSPVIVRASIAKTERISTRNAPDLAKGQARLLVHGNVEAALIAPGPVAPQLNWLQDVPLDARGRYANPRGNTFLVSLQSPDAEGRTRLTSANASRPWREELEARIRDIATETRSGTVPVVTGVTNGFRVEGTLPGESESQFFLSTKAGKPLTLVVLERPGQSRSVAVASGDIIDESATSVKPETLLWYRLACTLPAELPVTAGGNDAALANAWIGAMTSLGRCER